jgi:hypothetical protein
VVLRIGVNAKLIVAWIVLNRDLCVWTVTVLLDDGSNARKHADVALEVDKFVVKLLAQCHLLAVPGMVACICIQGWKKASVSQMSVPRSQPGMMVRVGEREGGCELIECGKSATW